MKAVYICVLAAVVWPCYAKLRVHRIYDNPTCNDANGDRLDCGYLGIGSAECQARGCCWGPVDDPTGNTPWCYISPTSYPSYKVTNNTLQGASFTQQLQLEQPGLGQFGRDFDQLQVLVEAQTDQRLHVKIVPPGVKRWEVPEDIIPRPTAPTSPPESPLYTVTTGERDGTFRFELHRPDGTLLLNFTTLAFKDQFLYVDAHVPAEASLYGAGESSLTAGLKLPRNGKILTMWNLDIPAASADVDLYGSHPFFLAVMPDGRSHGVFLLNSNGMDMVFRPDSVSYRAIGGVLDFYIFLGPGPEQVLQQYHAVIGLPAMVPYWSLGYHQCKWGYRTLGALQEVMEGYRQAGVPLEVIWSDIDYMDRYRDFTFDPQRFPEGPFKQFVDQLAAGGQHWVPILDIGMPPADDYPAHAEGVAADVWIKDVEGRPYLGQVWPGATHFPDFLSNATAEWWGRWLEDMHRRVPYSGLWLDMNEVSNFCTGEVCEYSAVPWYAGCQLSCRQPADEDGLSFPPYSINVGSGRWPLHSKTLPMNARHHSGAVQYDVHNLNGLLEVRTSHLAMKRFLAKRPFILSRSSFPSLGRWAAHWTGDNEASWANLRFSIQGLLNTNMWGIPMVGADICGFFGTTNEELCTRWISAGAFHTFVRNHADDHSPPQELYRWASVAEAGRKALALRYRLLPAIYSAMYMVHRHGGTVAKPVFFAAPGDTDARAVGTQWMLGEGLLVSPVVQPGVASLQAYIPPGVWYSAWDYSSVTGPATVELAAPLGHVPVHLRGGSITPMQQAAMTTRDVRASNITLVLALPEAKQQPSAESAAGRGLATGPYEAYVMQGLLRARAARVWQLAQNRSGPALAALLQDTRGMLQPSSSRLHGPHLAGAEAAAATGAAGTAAGRKLRGGQEAAAEAVASWVRTAAPGKALPAVSTQQVQQDGPEDHLFACGVLYMDDGETLDVGGAEAIEVWYSAAAALDTSSGFLAAEHVGNGTLPAGGAQWVDSAVLLGLQLPGGAAALPQLQLLLNGAAVPAASVQYDAASSALTVSGLGLAVAGDLRLEWSLKK